MKMQLHENTFPLFSILTGLEGSGKKTLIRKLMTEECTDCNIYYVPDVKVETIRNTIRDAYRVQSPTIFVIFDADSMSVNAKNALLKVTEEPPHKARFIMTVCDMNNMLDTIKSRATAYYMEQYKASELLEFARDNGIDEYDYVIPNICETPGDVMRLSEYNISEFIDYVDKVIDNVATVSLANAFKITQQLNFAEDFDKYDVDLFLRAFKMLCALRMKEAVATRNTKSQDRYAVAISLVTHCLVKMKIVGISKRALFDMFILDIRKEWGEDGSSYA